MDRRTAPSARRAAAGLFAAIIATMLVGCGGDPPPTPEEGATAAVSAFLGALADGNGMAALSMTTSTPDDFACGSMVQNGQEPQIASPMVLSVKATEMEATAAVTYQIELGNHYDGPKRVAVSLSVEKRGDDWLVILPESYQVSFEADSRLVAVASIQLVTDPDAGSDQTPVTYPKCDVRMGDAKVFTPALPGDYRVTLTDPTGMVTYGFQGDLVVSGGGVVNSGVVGVSMPGEYTPLWNAVSDSLWEQLMGCATTQSERPDVCLADFDGADLIDEDGLVFSDESRVFFFFKGIDRLWTEDGETWRFATSPQDMPLSRDGVIFALGRTYSGHFKFEDDGQVIAVLED